jgi:uncharacterized protein (TIGR03066 family)
MIQLLLSGILYAVFLMPAQAAGAPEPETPTVKKLLLGKWHWEDRGPSSYGMRLEFLQDGTAFIGMRINKEWSQHRMTYKVVGKSQLQVTFDIGNEFTHHYLTRTWGLEVTRDRLTLAMKPGPRFTFER